MNHIAVVCVCVCVCVCHGGCTCLCAMLSQNQFPKSAMRSVIIAEILFGPGFRCLTKFILQRCYKVYGSFLNIRISSTVLMGCVFRATCLLHRRLKVRVTIAVICGYKHSRHPSVFTIFCDNELDWVELKWNSAGVRLTCPILKLKLASLWLCFLFLYSPPLS